MGRFIRWILYSPLLICTLLFHNSSHYWLSTVVALTPYRQQPLFDAINSAAISGTCKDDAQRLFHGRGGVFQGCENLTLDWYPPVFLLTSFQDEISFDELDNIGLALKKKYGAVKGTDEDVTSHPFTWVHQHRGISNGCQTKLMCGQIPVPHLVKEGGNLFHVHLLSGQNHGLFLDMASGRSWIQKHSQGKSVLNLFAYTCSFSIAALRGGADEVVNVDMSKGALKIGQRNHDTNNFRNGVKFLAHDVFKTWGKIKKLAPFDVIIVDPPSYQKGSFVAKNDYIKLCRRMPPLLNSGGIVLFCLNAPELDSQFLHDVVASGAPELTFSQRLNNPESFPVMDPERALKVMVYQKLE